LLHRFGKEISARERLASALCAAAVLCVPAPVAAKGTRAGTAISNVASATFTDEDGPVTVTSNIVTMRVDEVLDVVVQPASTERPKVMPGEQGRALAFVVTNAGNGPENFALEKRTDLADDRFDPICPRLVLDSNGNNGFDPSTDVNYVAGSNDPALDPDQSITVFAICDVPATGLNADDWGSVRLDATAKTGSGQPGTVFANPNGDGIDAIVGTTTAKANALSGLVVGIDPPTITKAQAVQDTRGGASPMPGAVVTYTLTAAIRSGNVANTVVTDPIPFGTTYEAGSLRLDGTALSDAEDGDAGRVTAQGIEVRLGDLTAAASRIVSFKVRINDR